MALDWYHRQAVHLPHLSLSQLFTLKFADWARIAREGSKVFAGASLVATVCAPYFGYDRLPPLVITAFMSAAWLVARRGAATCEEKALKIEGVKSPEQNIVRRAT